MLSRTGIKIGIDVYFSDEWKNALDAGTAENIPYLALLHASSMKPPTKFAKLEDDCTIVLHIFP